MQSAVRKFIHTSSRCFFNEQLLYNTFRVFSPWRHFSDSPLGGSTVLPTEAQVVICGGGVTGCSIAYHLTKLGLNDVIILEQGRVTCGTTWHSVGLCSQFTRNTAVSGYSVNLYKELEQQGKYTGFKTCGSINMARTKERMTMMKRQVAAARAQGIECELITPTDVSKRVPHLKYDDLEGALWIPGDGTVNPTDLTNVLLKEAELGGAQLFEKCSVENVLTESGKVAAVETNLGNIKCEYFINCAGQWARELGIKSTPTVDIPQQSIEHFYIVSKPMGIPLDMPVLRDYDGYVYFREWNGGLMTGGIEPRTSPVFQEGIPKPYEFQLMPENWEQFQVLMDEILHRVPSMENAEIRTFVNGAECFTPDGCPIVGEAPQIRNYYIAAGGSASGVTAAGGVGYLMAQWIVDGKPSVDLWEYDIKRFTPQQNNKAFLLERSTETPAQLCKVFPHEYITGRNLQTSSLHSTLEQKGAVFGLAASYEIPMYFKDKEQQMWLTFEKPCWFENVSEEYTACKERVGLIDMSSMLKISLMTNDDKIVDFLQYLCASDVRQAVGSVIETGMLNNHGGYESDCTLVRRKENQFLVLASATQATSCLTWIKQHLPPDGSVQLEDFSSKYTALTMVGPKAFKIVEKLSGLSTKMKDFPPMTTKMIKVDSIGTIHCVRHSVAGEDGVCLLAPSEHATTAYKTLLDLGAKYDIRNVGYHTLNSLRIENYIPEWSRDISSLITPFECHEESNVKLEWRGDFLGHLALLKHKSSNRVPKLLTQLTVCDNDANTVPWPCGNEPIYHNGDYVGMTTSAAYSFSRKAPVCLGYVQDTNGNLINDDYLATDSGNFEIDIACKRYSCKVAVPHHKH